MGYLINSGTGFLKDAVTTVSNVKSYLVNKTGYLVDAIRIGIGDFGQRVLDDGGTVEASAEAAASYREITKDIYDQASLVLFPSGYKDNLLYSHKPVNGSGDFTYTRGTDTATRVGADGYIKKERANLLTYSNDFSNAAWAMSGSAPIGGQDGYDGSNDAWSIAGDVGDNWLFKRNDTIIQKSGVQTFSIYVKKNANYGIRIYFFGTLNVNTYFNLNNGTIVNESNTIDSKIEPVGSDWFRCSITFEQTTTQMYLYATDNSNVMLDGITHILQDAQLEQGLIANSYIETTTTAPVYEGLTDNLPRIDYTGGTPSILLEPSRTNEIGYSEYKASGDFTNSTPSYNAASSPEGLQNATEMFDDSTNGQHRVPIGSFAVTSGTDYTISAFVKNNDIGYCYLLLEGGFTQTRYYFNLSTGQPITSGLEVENFADGWYRIYVTQSAAASGTGSVYLNMSNNGASPIYVGSNQSLYFYGLQAEQGSYPTSYIPTYNASATRAADVFNDLNYSDSFNDITVFLNINTKNIVRDAANSAIHIGNDGNQGGAVFLRRTSAQNPKRLTLFFKNNDNSDAFASYQLPEGNVKLAFKYNSTSNDCKLFVDGDEERSATNITDITEFDTFKIGGEGGEANLKSLLVFNTALSDDDCEALTAL